MIRPAFVLYEEDDLRGIAEHMDCLDIRQVAVVDNRRLVGMLDQRALLRHSLNPASSRLGSPPATQRRQELTFVAEVMDRDVWCAHPTATMANLAEGFARSGQDIMPVVDRAATLLGLVRARDVACAALIGRPDATESDGSHPQQPLAIRQVA
ncbi:MAG: CBS domain-containing protein [Deltaproteobacteria bacterium]|nr:CBS domain-containing protein [Deltaproteobacteria bacterium]